MGEPSAWPADFNPALMVQLAEELGDVDRLLRYAPATASRAVASGSRREAVTIFRMVGPHLDRMEPIERGSILEEWANAVRQSGDIIRAKQLRERALRVYREAGAELDAARCMLEISADYWRSKQEKRAIENAALAVETLRALDAPANLQSDALRAQALIHYLGYNDQAGDEVIRRAIAIAPAESKQLAVAKATAVWGGKTWEEAQRLGQEALELADRVGSWRAVEIAYEKLTQWDHELPPKDRTWVLDDALAFAEAHQLDDIRAFTLLGFAQRHIDAGRYIDAEDVAREAATIWPDSEQNLAAWPLELMARPQLRRGSPQARENIEKLSEFVPIGPPINANLSELMAEAHWLDPSLPFDRGMALVDYQFSVDHPMAPLIADSSLIYWLWKLGIEVELPERLHSQYRHQIEGDWEAAAAEWSDWERPYEQALALSEGPPEAAISALAILDEIGAVRLATRIRRDLREQGVAGVPAGPRPSTRENVALLTARQMEVLRLMAEGGSNPEIADTLFISSRTAEHHVSAVLSKLNASTREEAVAMAADLGVLTAI
jgi:DNA-binding CsgD family transcriptional regulator/tetratricopeptide (TPR) repeat protein